jgi:hypothetical protein
MYSGFAPGIAKTRTPFTARLKPSTNALLRSLQTRFTQMGET